MESPIIENFPEDLLLEILLRLPVKSLVRFKCVSKSWFSFVSDPSFAKLHFDLTAPNNQQFIFKVSLSGFHKAQIYSINLERSLDGHLANFTSPIPSLPVNYIRIFGVCRGFILLSYSLSSIWNPPCLLVWNPSTGVHRTLPLSPIVSTFHPKYVLEPVCFEYDASKDDYFVVTAWIEHEYNGRFFRVNCFEFFFMRTNSWIQVDTPKHWCRRTQFGIWFSFVNGSIHWLSINDTAIIAFDSIERKISRINLPYAGFFRDYDVISLTMEVIEGCLCLLSFPRRQVGFAEVWKMKEYKVESSWIKSDYMHVDLDYSYMTMIVKVNDKGKLLSMYDHRPVYDRRSCFGRKYHLYAESLLSLPSAQA